jgi:hypothetical protein
VQSPAKVHVGTSPWERRYFTLHRGNIQYYKGTKERPKEVMKGELDLSHGGCCELEEDTQRLLKHFNLSCYDKLYRLRAETVELSKEWTDAFNGTIKISQDLYELISKLNNVLCKLHMTHNRELKKELESLVHECNGRNILSPVLAEAVEILDVLKRPHQSIMSHDSAIDELRAQDRAAHADADPHLVRELSRIREKSICAGGGEPHRRKTSKAFRTASANDKNAVFGPLPLMLEED